MAADRFVERDEIAFLLGVDVRTITNYVRKHPDFPTRVAGKHRTFPVQACLQWQRDRAVADAVANLTPPAPDDMEEAQRRKAIADAELAELKLAKLRGEVIDVTAAAREIRNTYARIRARLHAVPGEYASQLLNLTTLGDAVPKLRALVDSVIVELRTVGAGGFDDGEDEAEEPAA